MKTSTKAILYLIVLAVIDTIIPVPITALILIYVILERPPWFRSMVSDIFES